MPEIIKNTFLATLGIITLVFEKTEKFSKELIQRGEGAREKLAEKIEETLGKLNIPTKKDIVEINKKLDELTRRLEHI